MNEHEHPDLLDDALDALSLPENERQQSGQLRLCPVCFSGQIRVLDNELFGHGCQWCGACW